MNGLRDGPLAKPARPRLPEPLASFAQVNRRSRLIRGRVPQLAGTARMPADIKVRGVRRPRHLRPQPRNAPIPARNLNLRHAAMTYGIAARFGNPRSQVFGQMV
jgi:hypothetical protein